MIKTYSKKKDGDKYLAPNFRVREFACKDGTDTVPVSAELVEKLQALRDRLGVPINISSGYRSPEYNRLIGGSAGSQHMLGRAADITCAVDPVTVAYIAQGLGFGGVECGLGQNYVHVDVREGKTWRAVKPYADRQYETVPTLYPTVRYGSTGQTVNLLERRLKALGYYKGALDEHCGPALKSAITAYQRAQGLDADGVCGPLTWARLARR